MSAFDITFIFNAWLASFAGFFSNARALFWWPSIVTALLGAGVILLISTRRKAASPAAIAPTPERKKLRDFLRELPMDITCYLGYTLTQVALAFVMSDFCMYWSHRLFHGPRVLWWFHSLHHNPPVLTPVTAFRFWPPEAAVHFAAFNFGEGLALGIGNVAFGINITPLTYLGVNVFLLTWFLAFSHLRHSHIALGYPRWLSHILVSPHMHQAHHSVDPQHHHKNFGTALSLWDWLFGTLHIPAKDERYRFGIDRA